MRAGDNERYLRHGAGLALVLVLTGLLTVGRDAMAQSPTPLLRGVVVDTAGRPIAGAQLHLVGTSYRASSAENGTFRLEGLPPGQLL